MAKAGHTRASERTFFGRLARDVRGNTLAIMAAAMFPMIAMIGSGVDMTRAYMAQNRFRQACDAGALAGRRLLVGTTVNDAVTSEATKYFLFNFPRGHFQSSAFTLSVTAPQSGTLHIETESTVPTTLMKLFGFQNLPITASCSATQDFINTDLVLVFDLSGSMNCAPGGGGDCNDVEQIGSKIGALRDAAKSLYDTLKPAQDQLHDNNLRLRYGFVNYSSNMNVGAALHSKNPDYIAGTGSYRSRWPTWAVDARTYLGNISESDCRNIYSTYDSQAGSIGATGVMGGYFQRVWRGTTHRCLAFLQTSSDPDGLTYGQSPVYDMSAFKNSILASNSTFDSSLYLGVRSPVSPNDGPWTTTTPSPSPFNRWNGCVEERRTDAAAVNAATSNVAPTTAWDLDVDMIPSSDDSRWKPVWPEGVYWPDTRPSSFPSNIGSTSYNNTYAGRRVMDVEPNGVPSAPCPTASSRLTNYWNNESGFDGYVDGLRATGGTYHDLGIIWGARFLSGTGIFRSNAPGGETNDVNDPDNPTKIRGFSVKKYMIFMTDGDMWPQPYYYSSYGVEALDGRVSGAPAYNEGQLGNLHLKRFRMACNAAKAKGIDVWVIAFSTTLTNDMRNCASRPDQASGLSTRDQLIAKFQEIGSKIGSLRLSQ